MIRAVGFLALTAFLFLHVCELRAADNLVDANLVTGLDVSSSINAQETTLQIQGMADAIRAPMVVSAITSGPHRRIGFTVFLWADGDHPPLVVWRVIASQADADAVAGEMLARLQAVIAEGSKAVGTLTDLSAALDHARELVLDSPFKSERTLVNIIGNGEDNVGEGPTRARAALLALGATINGVVVGGDPAVKAYYRANVVGGAHAFVRSADKASDITGALISKFIAELAAR